MGILEGVLVILILIWTIIFVVIGVGVWIIFRGVKKALNRVDHILDITEQKAEAFDLPSKIAVASILGFMSKNSYSVIKKLVTDNFFNKGKK